MKTLIFDRAYKRVNTLSWTLQLLNKEISVGNFDKNTLDIRLKLMNTINAIQAIMIRNIG